MKYWLLTTEYPPAHGGGISTYCSFTAKMLSDAGYTVSVFVNDDSVADASIIKAENNIRIIKFNSNRDGLLKSLGYTARLSYAFAGIVKKMIEEEGKPDLIESQDYLGIAYYLTQYKHTGYSFLAGIPIVITIHSPAFIYLAYNRVAVYKFPDYWTGEMEKQSIAAADALISPTHFMLQEIKKYISLKDKLSAVIGNPYQIEQQPDLFFKRNKIIYYGKLAPQKGTFELLSYFKDLWDGGFPHALHLVGGTDIVFHPEMKTMGQLMQEQYKDYISKDLLQLHGKINPSQITAHIKDAHVIIVPSIIDNMPYVVMESMSRNKIVLASVQGGQAEMLQDGISGFLFDHTEPGSFSRQVNKILSLPDEAVAQVGSRATQYVNQHYSFEVIRNQKIKFIQQVVSMPLPNNHFPFLYQEKIQPVAEINDMPGLLSVVIPYYNLGKYIDNCIESVRNSTYKIIEILIINDGSTDRTSIEKLETLNRQTDIIVLNTANQGVAASRNYGAAAARGQYLAFLDADDMVATDYYEKAIAALKKNKNVFFAGAWVEYFENRRAVWPTFTPQPPYALIHNPVNSSGLVYKRNAFIAGGLNDKGTGYGLEDFESMIQMLANGFNGVILPEVLFYYRVRDGSMFRYISTEKLLFSNKYIAEKHHSYYALFAVPVINLLNANGPGYLYDNPTFETKVSVKSSSENIYFAALKAFIKKNEPLKRIALQLLKIKSKR